MKIRSLILAAAAVLCLTHAGSIPAAAQETEERETGQVMPADGRQIAYIIEYD